MSSTADVVARETAWLMQTGDTLPALSADVGGPFQIISGYWPRTPASMKSQLYVTRTQISEERTAHIRVMARHRITLILVWPMTSGSGSAEDDQAAFDIAIDQVLARIRGLPGDHSHGGRFLSAGEHPGMVTASYTPAADTMTTAGVFKASITYTVDDFEITA